MVAKFPALKKPNNMIINFSKYVCNHWQLSESLISICTGNILLSDLSKNCYLKNINSSARLFRSGSAGTADVLSIVQITLVIPT